MNHLWIIYIWEIINICESFTFVDTFIFVEMTCFMPHCCHVVQHFTHLRTNKLQTTIKLLIKQKFTGVFVSKEICIQCTALNTCLFQSFLSLDNITNKFKLQYQQTENTFSVLDMSGINIINNTIRTHCRTFPCENRTKCVKRISSNKMCQKNFFKLLCLNLRIWHSRFSFIWVCSRPNLIEHIFDRHMQTV